VPPSVIPKKDAMRKIYEVENDKNTINPKPKLRKFNEAEPEDNLNKPKNINDPTADFYVENKEGHKKDPENSNKNTPKS
jgi:hypothetical protein